jgi:hypothetical protein
LLASLKLLILPCFTAGTMYRPLMWTVAEYADPTRTCYAGQDSPDGHYNFTDRPKWRIVDQAAKGIEFEQRGWREPGMRPFSDFACPEYQLLCGKLSKPQSVSAMIITNNCRTFRWQKHVVIKPWQILIIRPSHLSKFPAVCML